MEWVSVKDKFPKEGEKVRVKVPDLSTHMMGIEIFLAKGEYTSTFRKKSGICCSDPRHNHYHNKLKWSNNAGYYATHWMPLSSAPEKQDN